MAYFFINLLNLPNQNQSLQTLAIETIKITKVPVDQSMALWTVDTETKKYKLSMTVNGQIEKATNGFYVINYVTIQGNVQRTYYFDKNGDMFTGWLKTVDNKTYFFDTDKTSNEGAMAIGWKEIQGDWYYFNIDGSMLVDNITPDGFRVNADGKWIK